MTTSRFRAAALAALLLMGATATAQGQTRSMHIGPRFGYNFDIEQALVGVQFSAPVARHLEFYPSFDYYFVDAGSTWALNGDLKYRIGREQASWLYVGTGVNVTRTSFGNFHNSDVGLNLFGGIESLRGSVHPFAEVRATVGDGSTAQIMGGLNFTIGH